MTNRPLATNSAKPTSPPNYNPATTGRHLHYVAAIQVPRVIAMTTIVVLETETVAPAIAALAIAVALSVADPKDAVPATAVLMIVVPMIAAPVIAAQSGVAPKVAAPQNLARPLAALAVDSAVVSAVVLVEGEAVVLVEALDLNLVRRHEDQWPVPRVAIKAPAHSTTASLASNTSSTPSSTNCTNFAASIRRWGQWLSVALLPPA